MHGDRGGRDAYVQAASRRASNRRKIGFGFVVRAKDGLGVTQQRAARFRKKEFFVDSEKEGSTNFFFELADVNAHSRLGKMNVPRRKSE